MITLNDKTIVICGHFGLLMQNLTTKLAECGSDVALLTNDAKSGQRLCQNIMDMREVSDKFGRAAALEASVTDEKSAMNNFSRAAEMFGSPEIYIDTHLFNLNIPYGTGKADMPAQDIEKIFSVALNKAKLMAQKAAPFLKGRSKGRLLFIFNELDALAAEKVGSPAYKEFGEYIKKLAIELKSQHTTVNALSLGITEEYLMARFTKSPTIQSAMKELVKVIPHARLVDYPDIANMISFLVSPLSSGLNGQIIRLDHAL